MDTLYIMALTKWVEHSCTVKKKVFCFFDSKLSTSENDRKHI